MIRDTKGKRDRATMAPRRSRHCAAISRTSAALHDDDLHDGFGAVMLPDALARKIPGAPKEWTWQWVFPATSRYKEQGTKIGH